MSSTVSIHAPRVGRDFHTCDLHPISAVSIHAPRVGRDTCAGVKRARQTVSIHAPRVGRDVALAKAVAAEYMFQFTRPAWGATDG